MPTKSLALFRIVTCSLLLSLLGTELYAQKKAGGLWSRTDVAAITKDLDLRNQNPDKFLVYRLNVSALQTVLRAAPLEFSRGAEVDSTVLSIPDPDGKLVRFRIEESPLLSPAIAAQFPNWKTYQGYGIDDSTATARFDWTDSGFHAYVLSSANGTYSIDPYQVNDIVNYQVYYKKDKAPNREFHCNLDEVLSESKTISEVTDQPFDFVAPEFSHGAQVRTFRLGIGTTFEFTNLFRQTGDTDTQAQTRAFNGVVTTVNRVSGVYRKDLAVSFELVSGTNLVYTVNPETPADYANTGSADLNANVTNMNAALTVSGYDVGHVFGSSNNGVAQLSSVCGASKARGYSGQPNPIGDGFDVDYVAHEMGHQFAANHTFNTQSNCNSVPANSRKEPGSAVTIMGYAGICSGNSNVARNSIDTFHVHSQTEAIAFLTSGAGASCGTLAGSNSVPIITPLTNFTIPFNTPFSLTASATDADNDPITYSWEQNDASSALAVYPATTDDDDINLTFRPGFRSYLPTPSGTRVFPSLPFILNNANEAPVFFSGINAAGVNCGSDPATRTCISGEDLPSSARTMNFRVTVRDGVGGVADAGTVLTVVNTVSPFRVSGPNGATTWYAGTNPTITWDVSGTDGGSINAANVKISLSTDGGQTFPTVLFASTANDGSESIASPVIDTTQARIKIEAIGNIFFDISDANFTITSTPATNGVVAGRVVKANGRGVGRVYLVLTGGSPSTTRIALTNSFGYYQFNAIPFAAGYTLTPVSGNGQVYSPANMILNHTTDITTLDFSVQ